MDIVGLLAASSIPELAEAIRLKEVSPDATCWSFPWLERHIQNSNTHTHLIDLEPDLQEGRAARSEPKSQPSRFAEGSYPLGMVLSACPDIVDYAKGGISNWRDFLATAAVVRSMLGDQSERLGGGANRPGRNASGGRRRMHSAAWHHDQISWRLLARADAESGGRGVFPWA